MAKNRKRRTLTFLVLGTVCLLGILSEYPVILVEQFIFDKGYYGFSITESITHWIFMCVLWGLLGLVLFYISARVYGFNFTKKKRRPTVKRLRASVLFIAAGTILKHLVFGGWKPLLDFRSSGWFQFIFQYIYYLFETGLLLIMIIFMQEACERILKTQKIKIKNVPWGGIILSLTWGLIHFATESNPAAALCYTLIALLIGAEYLASNKNAYITYILSALIFLI